MGGEYERRTQVEDYLKMTDSRPPAPGGGGAYDSLDAAAAALRECPYLHTNIDGARQTRAPCAEAFRRTPNRAAFALGTPVWMPVAVL